MICIIAALARNAVIGRNGGLPWRLPADLRRFKQLTLGHPAIMGRKTWDSILQSLGGPLPGRENIVISRSRSCASRGCIAVDSLEAAISAAGEAAAGDRCFVIGGAEIYRLALPLAGWMYLTEIDAEVEGDAYFPAYAGDEWQLQSRELGPAQEGLAYSFATYQRRPKPK